jgi:alanine racemase
MPTSWLELSRENLLQNLAGLRRVVGQARIMAVVKGNAYGAGAAGIARVLASEGVEAFAVANVAEAVELREHGIAGTMLCLTYFSSDEIDAILAHDLRPAVFTLDAARELSERARAGGGRVRAWIKVDTGLGRLGVHFQEAGAFIREVARQPHLEVEGLFTTLSENPERDPLQVKRLLDVRSQVPELANLLLSAAS